jgi:hypothetical protein
MGAGPEEGTQEKEMGMNTIKTHCMHYENVIINPVIL